MENVRGRGRGRRSRGRGRGRPKKNIEMKKENLIIPEEEEPITEHIQEPQIVPKIDMEADISQLEAPTFTTISRGPPEAMLRLRWGHPVNLLGEKVLNPMIHCCDQCLRPVLIYGRMIPCKHVFCLECAKRKGNVCPRCNENVSRVEHAGLGSVFMCTHGGTRYGSTGCRRTYLSQRDLQAHINHRHVSSQSNENISNQFGVHNPKVNDIRGKTDARIQPVTTASPFYDNQKPKLYDESEGMNYASPRTQEATNPLPRSSNLITVPLQEPSQESYYPSYNTGYYPTAYQEYPPPPPQTDTSIPPPPQQWQNNQQFYG
ncbi:UNVERIFIED_CONTAM: hypothetical protein PYX00_006889 [Menopon gallinae]|uniref:E3 ubiquitin-protein ligase Hakai n=1 Tax=Menopon gallinae TaxID=328185 RepID=A0AAW2HYQ4_9NEOP